MILFRCPNCDGLMAVDSIGNGLSWTTQCPYCCRIINAEELVTPASTSCRGFDHCFQEIKNYAEHIDTIDVNSTLQRLSQENNIPVTIVAYLLNACLIPYETSKTSSLVVRHEVKHYDLDNHLQQLTAYISNESNKQDISIPIHLPSAQEESYRQTIHAMEDELSNLREMEKNYRNVLLQEREENKRLTDQLDYLKQLLGRR